MSEPLPHDLHEPPALAEVTDALPALRRIGVNEVDAGVFAIGAKLHEVLLSHEETTAKLYLLRLRAPVALFDVHERRTRRTRLRLERLAEISGHSVVTGWAKERDDQLGEEGHDDGDRGQHDELTPPGTPENREHREDHVRQGAEHEGGNEYREHVEQIGAQADAAQQQDDSPSNRAEQDHGDRAEPDPPIQHTARPGVCFRRPCVCVIGPHSPVSPDTPGNGRAVP